MSTDDKPGTKPGFDPRRLSERFRRENPQHIRTFVSVNTARFLSRLARAMPDSVRYWLADRLGNINYLCLTGYRRNVLSNLRRVHKSAGLPPPTQRNVRTVFRTSSRNWADLLVAPKRTETQFRNDVEMDPESVARLDAAYARGKGCVLITAHVGAFDFIGHYLHAIGYHLLIMTGRTTTRLVFDGVTYLRQANGLPVVEATASGVRKAIQAVHAGDATVVVCDRDFFHNGMEVLFFGERTTLSHGAIRIARDTGAMIVPVYGYRLDRGHRIRIHETFAIERTNDAQADMRAGMDKVIASLEKALTEAPDQWVMFQSVWPKGASGSDA
jgi:lauroyl/myristoyl acyltransferase